MLKPMQPDPVHRSRTFFPVETSSAISTKISVSCLGISTPSRTKKVNPINSVYPRMYSSGMCSSLLETFSIYDVIVSGAACSICSKKKRLLVYENGSSLRHDCRRYQAFNSASGTSFSVNFRIPSRYKSCNVIGSSRRDHCSFSSVGAASSKYRSSACRISSFSSSTSTTSNPSSSGCSSSSS